MGKVTAAIVRFIRVDQSLHLPDNDQWTNRFEVPSSSSDNMYTVAQNKSGRWWACSCRGWVSHKHCRHLEAMGVPCNYIPYEAQLKS